MQFQNENHFKILAPWWESSILSKTLRMASAKFCAVFRSFLIFSRSCDLERFFFLSLAILLNLCLRTLSIFGENTSIFINSFSWSAHTSWSERAKTLHSNINWTLHCWHIGLTVQCVRTANCILNHTFCFCAILAYWAENVSFVIARYSGMTGWTQRVLLTAVSAGIMRREEVIFARFTLYVFFRCSCNSKS